MKKSFGMFLASLVLLFIAGAAWAAFEKEEPAALVSDFAPDIGPVANSPELPLWPGVDMITWTTGANMDTARYGAVSGWYNGEVYFAHGRISNAVPYNSSECASYNPVTNVWTHRTNAPTARRMVGAGVVQSGTFIHSVGGRFDATTTVGTYERYDMATDTWVTLAPCTPRWAHGAAALANGDVYVFGGSDASVNLSCQKYNPATNSWSAAANLPAARGWCAGASLNGKVYCIGGSGASTMYEYDPALNTWTAMAPLPSNRFYHWAYGDPVANKIYVFGGATVSAPTADALYWDPTTNTWSMDDPMPAARTWPSVGGNMAGTAFVCGGFDGSAIYYNQTWIGDLHAANPLAPAAPTGFTVANNGPALTATLSWTNPTLTVNGQPLVSIDSIVVKRGTTIVASLFGNPGQAMNYNDNVPSVGSYGYMVAAVNSYGEGIPATGSAWIGLDTPGPVTGLTGSGVGVTLVAVLDWTNPTSGQHGGYWPPGSIDGYTINRYGPSPATFNVIGITTTYTDNTVPVQGWYHYGVIASNGSGNGPEVMTPNFYIGPPEFEAIPYNWVEISGVGTNTGITGDDQNLGPFPMGINFNHYGTIFSSIRVCSNGWLSFTSTVTAYTNVAIPTAAEPNNLIAALWDDLYPPAGGIIYYYFDSANSRFIVEYDNVPTLASPQTPQKFEAIFYPNGDIDLMYHTVQAPCVNANTVGKENPTGTVGVQVTYNGSGPLEPASSTGIRIFGQPAGPFNVTVALVPITYPIQIPATGGSFSFYAFITNNETYSVPTTLWTEQILPDSTTMGPLLGPVTVELPPGVRGYYRTQNVRGTAMPGLYTYIGKAGFYPQTVWDSDQFNYTKLTTGDGLWVGDWNNYGDPITEEVVGVAVLPTQCSVKAAYPNPFNPTTTIGFALPEAARVTLMVYDISGRQVATLVNGWREAGAHEVTFDGLNLTSGIYVYRLSAGAFSDTGKMVLMK